MQISKKLKLNSSRIVRCLEMLYLSRLDPSMEAEESKQLRQETKRQMAYLSNIDMMRDE